jgi:Putative Actinobacterial Holin-X, holin superfamily III
VQQFTCRSEAILVDDACSVEGTPLASPYRMPTADLDHRDEPATELISGVLSDARDLAVAEVDKLKAEAITQVKEVGQEVKMISVGALILTVAAMMLGVSLSLGLAQLGLPAWSAFGIVAIVCGAIGAAFLKWRAGSR